MHAVRRAKATLTSVFSIAAVCALYLQAHCFAARCCQAKACHPTLASAVRTRQRPVRQAVVVRLRARAEAARMAWTNASVSSARGAVSGPRARKTDKTKSTGLLLHLFCLAANKNPSAHCPRYVLQRRRTCPPIALCASSKARLSHCDSHGVTGDCSFPRHVACVDQRS